MINHALVYDSTAKGQWREYVHNVLTTKNSYKLIDADGNFKYKWLEPIGTGALPFTQLIQSGRIQESQLIGVDLDPKDPEGSKKNIEDCKIKFPQAEFKSMDWASYCRRCEHKDIGYFIFDLYFSTFGENLEKYVKHTIPLIDNCKENIGEVLLVVNCDFGIAKRRNKGTAEEFAGQLEKLLKTSRIETTKNTSVNPETMYTYQNGDNSTVMATFALIL